MSNTAAAELGVVAEGVGSYRSRIGSLAGTVDATTREDLVTALYEAERCLGVAEAAIRRARRLA